MNVRSYLQARSFYVCASMYAENPSLDFNHKSAHLGQPMHIYIYTMSPPPSQTYRIDPAQAACKTHANPHS